MYGKYVIAGSGSGVFISDDRGDHWRSFNDGLPLFRNIPGFTNYVYTLCIFNGRIYVGNDDGGTFSRPVSDLQLLNGSLNVYADDENHPDLKRNELILSTDFLDEELPPIKICADGSNVTLLKYVNHNPALANSSIKFRIQSEGLISVTGEFKDEDIRISGDTIIARLTHPQLVIPTITKAFDYRPDSIEIFNVTQDTVLHTYPIEIYRAPLVLVHGLWGDRNSFDGMYHAYDRNIPWIRPVDYATTNSSNFSTNRRVVRDAIDAILSNARSSSFLTGKAVVVGHSMGGILTRLYLQNAFTDVFYRNDISKVITLNTPHYGSQSAIF
ncbi:MAG: alpha/beta fold hydrolase [Bacteroidota bacterium]